MLYERLKRRPRSGGQYFPIPCDISVLGPREIQQDHADLFYKDGYVRTRTYLCQFASNSRINFFSLASYFMPAHAPRSVLFPKFRPHAPNTIQTPARKDLSFFGRIGQSIWAITDRLKEQDAKHAIKTGMATAILAAPAFFDATRPVFTEYRGEWALISVRFMMATYQEHGTLTLWTVFRRYCPDYWCC